MLLLEIINDNQLRVTKSSVFKTISAEVHRLNYYIYLCLLQMKSHAEVEDPHMDCSKYLTVKNDMVIWIDQTEF